MFCRPQKGPEQSNVSELEYRGGKVKWIVIIVLEQIEQPMRAECELNSITAHRSGALAAKKTRFPRRIIPMAKLWQVFVLSDKINGKHIECQKN